MKAKPAKTVFNGPDKFYEIYTFYTTGKKTYLETKEDARVEAAKVQVKDPLVMCVDIECVLVSPIGKVTRASIFNYYKKP